MDKVRVYGEEIERWVEDGVVFVVLAYEDWIGATVVGIGSEVFEVEE